MRAVGRPGLRVSLMSPTSNLQPPVVVTGACGFIGRYVVQHLADYPGPVVLVDRVLPTYALPSQMIFHRTELAEPTALVPPDMEVDAGFVLVHLAWDMRRGPTYAGQMAHVQWLAALLDYWGERGLKRFIGLGSAEEYGARSGVLYEWDPPIYPLSPYGLGKYTAWSLARSWGARAGRDVLWLRPFIAYGPGQRGSMVLPYALEQLRAGAEATFSDGLQERDFVHVDDVARAIRSAVETTVTGVHAVNLGTGQSVAVRDVLQYLAGQMNAAHLIRLGVRPRRHGEPARQTASVNVAEDVLGWRARIAWQDGVRRLVGEN